MPEITSEFPTTFRDGNVIELVSTDDGEFEYTEPMESVLCSTELAEFVLDSTELIEPVLDSTEFIELVLESEFGGDEPREGSAVRCVVRSIGVVC